VRAPGYGDDGTRFWGNVPPTSKPAPARTRARSTDWWLGRHIATQSAGDLYWLVSSIDVGGRVVLRCKGDRVETTLSELHAAQLKGDIDVI